MFRPFILLILTIAACAPAAPAGVRATAPTTSEFDGKYIGNATQSGGWADCPTMTSVYMAITGGQVVIHETFFNGSERTYHGSVNAAGEILALFQTATMDILSGTIHDKGFAGHHLVGKWCDWSLKMAPAPTPTMPFDGVYIGVSRESRSSKAGCSPSGVPGALTIRNSVALGRWQGTVSRQGILSLRSPNGTPGDGQIDRQGIIRGQDASAVGCSSIWVWRKL
jgi:hypothetical protein